MNGAKMATEHQHESKTKLLNAALQMIRTKCYTAATADDICHQAGVTKGRFFHHFKSKDELALAAVEHWNSMTRDIEAARKRYAPRASWRAESVGYFIQSVLQGAFIFAKAKQGPEVVEESLVHLRRYIQLLFKPAKHKIKETS